MVHKRKRVQWHHVCWSWWETVITPDHFLSPIGHLSSCAQGTKCLFHFACDSEKAEQWWPHTRDRKDGGRQCICAKNVLIPLGTDLLKPEEQKCYFLQSLKITQWLLSLLSWHSNYARLRNAGASRHAWSLPFKMSFFNGYFLRRLLEKKGLQIL